MSIIRASERRTVKGRLLILAIYGTLIVGSITMVYPFMVMLTGAMCNSFDYARRDWLPRWAWSRPDRFMRVLCTYFPPTHRGSTRQMRQYYPDLPQDWKIWLQIGDDRDGTDRWAQTQLARLENPKQRAQIDIMATDYGDFAANWPPREAVLAYDERYVAPFLRDRYKKVSEFNRAWEVSLDDFTQANAREWSGEPLDQPNYVPEVDVRYEDLMIFREAYRENRFTPYLKGEGAPATYLRPASLRFVWEDYVTENAANLLEKTSCDRLPFPVPETASAALRNTWRTFLRDDFPARHLGITVTPARRQDFKTFLQDRFPNVAYLNRILELTIEDWNDVVLTPGCPDGKLATVWMDFVRSRVAIEDWQIRETLPDLAFQRFALERHGSLPAISAAYGVELDTLEQLRLPFGEALLVTFINREKAFAWDLFTANFRTVTDYLLHRGRAVPNTIILVTLALIVTLTVNPLCGYALSRFRMRSTERVIVFCLATMAFPASVAAVPGFLLLRDLGLLNTFAALILPGAANGMSIFLLKGFFDSLPQELYEAAAIDGAPEWQVFWRISLPLVKPILAVNMLNTFILTYNGWQWAIIVCQDKRMWTVSVWTYQFYQTLTSQPYIVMAAFIMSSLPVLLVFLFCQKIILRGIILPSLK